MAHTDSLVFRQFVHTMRESALKIGAVHGHKRIVAQFDIEKLLRRILANTKPSLC